MPGKKLSFDSCICNVIHEDIVTKVRKKMPEEESLISLAELFKVFGDSTRIKIISAYCSPICAYVT